MWRVKVVGTGIYVPPLVETAADIAPRIGKTEEWILARTGVARRHVSEEPMEVMAGKAARMALAGTEPDLVINASTTPRQLIPDSSTFILRELGLEGTPGLSLHSTCLSFLVAFHVAASLVHSGMYRRVLVVSSEKATITRNWDEPESAPLFGDGAGAAVLEPTPAHEDSALLSWSMGTWPKGAEYTEIRGGGIRRHPLDPSMQRTDYLFHMDGPGVYKLARRRAALVVARALKDAGFKPEEVDVVVPHQGSGPVVESLSHYGFPADRVVNVVGEYGNCIAASIPMALHDTVTSGRIQRGHSVFLGGTGAGLSIACAVLRW